MAASDSSYLPVTIQPFDSQHVEAAARLLAERHRVEQLTFPFLPALAEPAAARAISASLSKPYAYGAAAFQNGVLAGYLIGYPTFSTVFGRGGWIDIAGHAASQPDVIHTLYMALSNHWIQQGCFDHHVVVSAANAALLESWFSLSFGKQQAYAVAALADDMPTHPMPADLEIRCADPEDRDIVRQIAVNNATYQTRAPVFAPAPPEYLDEVRKSYLELLDSPDEGTIWLALKGGQVVGYQVYTPAEPDDANLFFPQYAIELPAAGTLEAVRGGGVGTALTRYCFEHYRREGYQHVVIDWRTTNILASRFWTKMGFVPTAYRLARSIDPRIAWAHA